MTPLALAGLLSACSATGNAAAPPVTTTTTTVRRCKVTTQTKLERIDLKVGAERRYGLVHIPAQWDGQSEVPVVLKRSRSPTWTSTRAT